MTFMRGTIFCVLVCVTQVFAKPTEKLVSAEGLRIFVSLTQTDPEIAQKLDASFAASLGSVLSDLEKPQHIELFNQILLQPKVMQSIFSKPQEKEYQAIQQLRQVYRAYEIRNAEILSSKLSQLRNTEKAELIKEVFAMLPLEQETLLKIADTKINSPIVTKWRAIVRDLIEYTHSYNRALRIEAIRAFEEVAAAKNFNSADARLQWTEYYNQVWSEVHPSNPNVVRSCYRVLSAH